ncbi:MAG: hypothetical protein H6810_01570 [Phycisphaeraceae bacterium]|nr:MAG: hypothetical protein H6810_01570 [Phycisphaeraceae bacterium]
MRMGRWSRGEIMDAGARYRAEHSAWLTLALYSNGHYPRIPAKPTRTGGFERLMSRASGRRLALRWWEIALSRLGGR